MSGNLFVCFFGQRFFGNRKVLLNRFVSWKVFFLVSTLCWFFKLVYSGGPNFEYDSDSYVAVASVLSEGEFDCFRTPGYPGIILLAEFLFGSCYAWAVVIFQQIVFLISIVLLWDMAVMYIGNCRVANVVSVVYLFLPVVLHHDNACALLTESLGVSSVILLFWLSFRYFKLLRGRSSMGLSSFPLKLCFVYLGLITLILLWCVALRPGYIYLLPLYFLFWGYICVVKRGVYFRAAVGGFVGLFVVASVVQCYKMEMKREYGYNGLSTVTALNNYFFVRVYDLLQPQYIKNDSLRADVESFVRIKGDDLMVIWNETRHLGVYGVDGWVELDSAINISLRNNPRKCLGALLQRVDKAGDDMMFQTGMLNLSSSDNTEPFFEAVVRGIAKIFVPRLSSVYLFLLLYWIYLCVGWYRTKRFDCVGWFLWGSVVAGHAVALIGAFGDWGRLTVQTVPALLLLIGRLYVGIAGCQVADRLIICNRPCSRARDDI